MPGTPPEEDDALLERLRGVIGEVDPVPPLVLAAAREAFDWRDVDAELARLVADSAEQDAMALAVRGHGDVRTLTFELEARDGVPHGLEVEVSQAAAGSRRIVGQLLPPMVAKIEVRHAGGVVDAASDERGRFAADGVQPGPVSLMAVLSEGSRTVATPWVRV